jgi:hypothetical protein
MREPTVFRHRTEESMGKSNQSGWIVLRGKRWYGYYRKQVIDPTTEDVRVSVVPVRLGLKSQMTKLAARIE